MTISPMMQQYLQTKEKYKDCIVMCRLGDFYEMFFEDAVTASRELELTLTGRDCGLESRAPMCGVPYHAVDNYIARLIAKGYKVAICEQLTPPGKKLIKRDVVRVVTAGTVTESVMLDERANNFLAAVFYEDEKIGLAWSDISTGEFNFNQFDTDALNKLGDALVRISPVEIICNEPMLEQSYALPCVQTLQVPNFGMYRADAWEYGQAKRAVETGAANADGDKKLAVCAAGALICYVSEMQKQPAENLNRPTMEDESSYLYMDATTRRNLELTSTLHEARGNKGTLLWLLDQTATGMGKRLIRKWIEMPLYRAEAIRQRQDTVQEFVLNLSLVSRLRDQMKKIMDLERLSSKVSYHSVSPKDMAAIRDSLLVLPELVQVLSEGKSILLDRVRASIDPMDDLKQVLQNALVEDPPAVARDGGFVKKGFDAELDELSVLSGDAGECLLALEKSEKEATGIHNLKVGYNRVFGYYIEVAKSQIDLVPYRYQRKQTTVSGERYITQELKEMEEKILSAKDRSLQLELKIFDRLTEQIRANTAKMLSTAKALATLDCLISLALVANDYGYVRPEICDDDVIEIKDGRHPTLEQIGKEPFVPNDTILDCEENRVAVITGPNMAGKSTYMRQVALIVIMAHIGSFVPASRAKIGLTDRVFTRIGASDDLLAGRSTFMVEMLEVANILDNATTKSLLLLDEIGRGTSTYDGLSIAWAVTEYLSALKVKALFSTHYRELTDLENRLDGVKNYRITVKELAGTVIFLHKIVRGGAKKSFGIEVASLAGVNPKVIERAKQILQSLELEKHNLSQDSFTAVEEETEASFSAYRAIESILSPLDLNTLTPLQAFDILVELKDKLRK